MNREEKKDFILTCLTKNAKNSKLNYEKMKYHINSKNSEDIYTAPVNPKYMERDHTPIILANNVYDALTLIDDYNYKKGKEVPYIIYGKITKGGAIYLDDIYCDFHKLKESSATFDSLEEFLHLRLNVFIEDNMKNQVIVLGHTHPFTGPISFNFSVSDLIVHLNYFSYNVFCQPQRGNLLLSIAKNITKDFNFISYDYKNQIFVVYDKVYFQEKKRKFIPLSSCNFCDN